LSEKDNTLNRNNLIRSNAAQQNLFEHFLRLSEPALEELLQKERASVLVLRGEVESSQLLGEVVEELVSEDMPVIFHVINIVSARVRFTEVQNILEASLFINEVILDGFENLL